MTNAELKRLYEVHPGKAIVVFAMLEEINQIDFLHHFFDKSETEAVIFMVRVAKELKTHLLH